MKETRLTGGSFCKEGMKTKNLVIHDLGPEEWEKISEEYSGWNIVTDNGNIHPCIGCFSCWNRTPGKCAIHDGYENMGSLIHQAGEVVVISRYTYGGFSGSVKGVFDRCLGYVLPQFEVTKGETHHKKRFDEDKPYTFIFHGSELTDPEKESARKYVQAVCTNIRGHVKNVIFRECRYDEKLSGPVSSEKAAGTDSGKVIILNGSMRNIDGNSAKLARTLSTRLKSNNEIIDLRPHLKDLNGLTDILEEARSIVLCVPLYVDGLPSQVIKLMETMEKRQTGPKRIYLLANMGLYESSQLDNLFGAVKQWCAKTSCQYCGGLGVSAGELMGTLMDVIPFRRGTTKKASQGMDRLVQAIDNSEAIGDIYAEPFAFPRWLYVLIANTNWNRTSRKNGIRPKDMYTRDI